MTITPFFMDFLKLVNLIGPGQDIVILIFLSTQNCSIISKNIVLPMLEFQVGQWRHPLGSYVNSKKSPPQIIYLWFWENREQWAGYHPNTSYYLLQISRYILEASFLHSTWANYSERGCFQGLPLSFSGKIFTILEKEKIIYLVLASI